MIINLKNARRDLVPFLRGIKTLMKDGLKTEFLVYQQDNELLFLLWDNENSSFFGFSYPCKGEQEKIRCFVDIDEFLKQITILPPNQNTIDVTLVEQSNLDDYLVIKPKKKFTKSLNLNLDTIETIPFMQGREILLNIYGTLNQVETPEVLNRLFYLYLPEENKHKFFSLDTKKLMGFTLKGGETDQEKVGAMFAPLHLANFAVAMSPKTKVNVSLSAKTVQFKIDGKGKKTVLGALYSEVPEKVISKIEDWEKPSNNNLIQISSSSLWDLLFEHEKIVTNNGGNTATQLLGLKLGGGKLTGTLTKKSIPLINKDSFGSTEFELPLTQLDFLTNLLKKGVKGTIEIIPSESSSMPHRVKLISDVHSLEWIIPRLAIATTPKEASSINRIQSEMKRKKKAEKIKIIIIKNGVSSEFYLNPSPEGILMHINNENIVLTCLPEKRDYEEEEYFSIAA